MGNAPHQPTVCSSILQRNMDPNELRQLCPSEQEAPWAQHKSGSKRVDGGSSSKSPAGDVSEVNRDGRSQSHWRHNSSDSSSSSRWPSLPSKRLRADCRSPIHHSCSQDNHWHSPGPSCLRASPSQASCRSLSPTSHSQRRRSRDCSAPSRHPSLTMRLVRNTSLLPRCPGSLTPSEAITSGPLYAPSTKRKSPNCHSRYSSSRSYHPHLDVIGAMVPVLAVHTPGLLNGIINNGCTRQSSVF